MAGATERPATSLGHERDERNLPRALDRGLQLSLMHRARPGDPPRQDLAALGHEGTDQLHVLVVDVVDLVRAELADLAAAEHRPALSGLVAGLLLGAASTAAARASLSKRHVKPPPRQNDRLRLRRSRPGGLRP